MVENPKDKCIENHNLLLLQTGHIKYLKTCLGVFTNPQMINLPMYENRVYKNT
jgi:hypothetical protein